MAIRSWLLIIGLSVGLAAGCEHADPLTGPDPDPEPEPTLSAIQASIFTPSCAVSGCHAGNNPSQRLNLSEGEAFEDIVGVASREKPALLRVDPGNPDGSYLLHKVEGRADIAGQRMPLGRDPLSTAQIQLIRDWISAGAPNN